MLFYSVRYVISEVQRCVLDGDRKLNFREFEDLILKSRARKDRVGKDSVHGLGKSTPKIVKEKLKKKYNIKKYRAKQKMKITPKYI